MRKILFLAFVFAAVFSGCGTSTNSSGDDDGKMGQDDFIAYFADTPPDIDGVGNDAAWAAAEWRPIKYEWMFNTPPNITPVKNANDFSGKFKVVWTANRLYILAEIIDDIISTTRSGTPYTNPENDDCLELFIDENASGGARGSDGGNNFFTYHLSFGGINVVDHVGSTLDISDNNDSDPTLRIQNGNILRNSHLNYKINKNDAAHTYTWEVEMKVYNNTYPAASSPNSTPVTLTDGKIMGFAVAYCDADAKNTREHFIGSMFVKGNTDNERNIAYKDSTQYAKLHLAKEKE